MAEGDTVRFCWNDHAQYVSKVLLLQRLHERLCDVTLISDDGCIVKAHQAILVSASGFFKSVLKGIDGDQHPTVVLTGIQNQVLCSLLDYMYTGVTRVSQALLQDVTNAASALQVKGLENLKLQLPSKGEGNCGTVIDLTLAKLNTALDHEQSKKGRHELSDESSDDASHEMTQMEEHICKKKKLENEICDNKMTLNESHNLDPDFGRLEHVEMENFQSKRKSGFGTSTNVDILPPGVCGSLNDRPNCTVSSCVWDGKLVHRTGTVKTVFVTTLKCGNELSFGFLKKPRRKTGRGKRWGRRGWKGKKINLLDMKSGTCFMETVKSSRKEEVKKRDEDEEIIKKKEILAKNTERELIVLEKDDANMDEEASENLQSSVLPFEKLSDSPLCMNPVALFTLPPQKRLQKQKRTTLTLQQKVAVVESFLQGKSQRQMARMHGVGKTQISGIIRRRQDILASYRSLLKGDEKGINAKRHRRSEFSLLNRHLAMWFRHMSGVAGVQITASMVRAKALQIAPQLGYHDFKASNGWLATLKANHNLKWAQRGGQGSALGETSIEGCEDRTVGTSAVREEQEYFDDCEDESQDMATQPSLNLCTGHHEMPVQSDSHGTLGIVNTVSGNPIVNPIVNLAFPGKPLSQLDNHNISAYNLTREIAINRDESVSDLSVSSGLTAGVSHVASRLDSHGKIDNSLSGNSLSSNPVNPLTQYKSDDSVSQYGYEHHNRMTDHSPRGTDYNYTPYSFPAGYYGYHFLGQY